MKVDMPGEKILIHSCCAPCLAAPLKQLSEKGWQTTAFFFNPNIHPYTEYLNRRDSLINFCELLKTPLTQKDDYALEEFLRGVVFKEKERCRFCYELRLRETVSYAKKENFPFFTTTLLVSPYQKHELLKEIGVELAAEFGIEFLYSDFRELWPERNRLTREYNLYRQQYCGCVYSEKERYYPKNKTSKPKKLYE